MDEDQEKGGEKTKIPASPTTDRHFSERIFNKGRLNCH